MKTIKQINHVIVLALITATVMFVVSCKKEISNAPTSSKDPVSLSDANKDIFNQFAFSPWHMRSSGESVSERSIIDMSEPDQSTCYGIIFDNLGLTSVHDISITHDGGATWHSQTIPGLENNQIYGVAANTASNVHVFGNDLVNGGGNVFHSADGGNTWQREAANAYTDPASYPDDIEFFDPKNGVIFGDPLNGSFEIYTTSNGGTTWNRVPSNKIPAPLANEYGIDFHSDTYLNTIWVIVSTVDENFNPVSSRLLQSDDKGKSWYVRNPLLTFYGYDGTIKFRNRLVGLYKNNEILYRTTDGGTTWNVVNYSGTWFSFDFDNIPGLPGWWISTGGGTPDNPDDGFGSSVSYDDGNHWVTLDTLNHTCVDMTSPFHGYSGGITTSGGNDGVYVYSLLAAKLSSLATAGNATTTHIKANISHPSGSVFLPGDKSAALRRFKHR